MTLALPKDEVLIHVVNVAHGDAIILELPVFGDKSKARFGIVDAGRPEKRYRDRFIKYLKTLIQLRGVYGNRNFSLEFVCITHPHEDHYGALRDLLDDDFFIGKLRQFWDCGFRTNSITYNKLLEKIATDKPDIIYDRVAAGFECELGDVRVIALAPSLDLRNRFDTYGVDRNNGSIVLQVQKGRSIAILAGDAFLESWGKILEEFPRRSKISFSEDAQQERPEDGNQLNCQLLKVSHHGSKRGSSLEYLEKMSPSHLIVTCAKKQWYTDNEPKWGKKWPHPLFNRIYKELPGNPTVLTSAEHGNVIYRLTGSRVIKWTALDMTADNPGFEQAFSETLSGEWQS